MTDSIVVIYKRSRLERDREDHGRGPEELNRFYRACGLSAERIRRSHERQMGARTALRKLLPQAVFLEAGQAGSADTRRARWVVALGGDNHFQRVARWVNEQVIVGINSDPQTSAGALTPYTLSTFRRAVDDWLTDRLPVERWTRLSVSVDGNALPQPALGEVYVGERDRCAMSRHILHWGRRREEQKSSGLLAVTGCGSTGWYASAGQGQPGRTSSFRKTAREFRFLLTEPHRIGSSDIAMPRGKLKGSDHLTIVSLNRRSGVVCLDAFQPYPLPVGATVRIGLGQPLSVAMPRPA